jgi:hypothetical protein
MVFEGTPNALHASSELASRYLGLGVGDLST